MNGNRQVMIRHCHQLIHIARLEWAFASISDCFILDFLLGDGISLPTSQVDINVCQKCHHFIISEGMKSFEICE